MIPPDARAGGESQASPEEKRLQIAEEALDYYRRRRLHYRTRLAEQIVKCRWMERRTQKHRRIITRLLALRRVSKEHPAGWQPIATAPKRGNSVLLLFSGDADSEGWIATGYWGDEGQGVHPPRLAWVSDAPTFYTADCMRLEPQPTHWQPLPAPPEVTP